jgi:flavin reductase (DIM6/NTAB) family NADH-FMN oxidoreductase RutF
LEPVTPSAHDVTPPRFRGLMSSFPSDVSIVTARDADGTPRGMTCSALWCSVTVDPPTLLVGIRAESPTLRAAVRSGRFPRAADRRTVLLRATERFRLTAWNLPAGGGGPHLTEAAHTVADCRITHMVDVGQQRIVFGEVFRITELTKPEPLLYGLRQYGFWPGNMNSS